MSNESPRQVRRREKLRALLGKDPGAQADLARLIDTPKSHLSAILAGRRGIGDALAAKLEAHYDKPPGWIDEEASAWPFSAQLQERVAALSEQKLLSLEVAMWHHLDEEAPEDVQTRLRQARAKLERLTEQVAGVEQVTPLQETIRKV